MILLRGEARIVTTEILFTADEIDYNRDTEYLEARGHVHFEQLVTGEKLDCEKIEYYLGDKTGKFYKVKGTSPSRIEARPGLLTTQNPFYFEGEWAERYGDRYIVHNGFMTDCLVPRPWWRLTAQTFDVIPKSRAIVHSGKFYLRNYPVFYFPVFYKSLKKQPRESGFLAPEITPHSSRKGAILGLGYFWAINRSYDLLYIGQLYTKRGFAHNMDFRGKVNDRTDFGVTLFGVHDRGTEDSAPAPGVLIGVNGKSYLGRGWEAKGELNYLSSFAFRQTFTESFHEAIFSQTRSVGYVTKHWSDYAVTLVSERMVNFQSALPDDKIVLRKLPQLELVTREHAIRNWPVWVSMESSYGLVRRSQPAFQTRQFVDRLDFAPRIMSAFHWKGFDIAPSFGIRETTYDSSRDDGKITGGNVTRSARDILVDVSFPALAKVFAGPKWFGTRPFGEKLKHVIEPRATYRFVTGIDDFQKIVRFDSMELMTNTNEVEFSLTNRILGKNGAGPASDVLSWEIWYKRYFDPTFGGAVTPDIRNVIQSSADLTGYAFVNGLRHQSPVVSVLRVQSRVALEWRADYDPVRQSFVNSGVTADVRFLKKILVVVGHYDLKTDPVLAPSANQFRGQISVGGDNKRGWSYGFAAFYDYKLGVLQYSQTQVTYNTNCCGFSVQYRRFDLQNRSNDGQFRVSFAISNIGSVGTLKRQERIF